MSRCTHINRSGPLHPSVKIGGASMDQCENEAFPELVVCYEHANKEALALLYKQAMRRLESSMCDAKIASENYQETQADLRQALRELKDARDLVESAYREGATGGKPHLYIPAAIDKWWAESQAKADLDKVEP